MSYLSSRPGPEYLPGEFDLPDNYNVLQISEIHAFEEFDSEDRERYCREVGLQVNEYVETYEVDEIHLMGDTGTFDDIYAFLNTLEAGPEVKIVAGDEDKKDSDPDEPDEDADEFTGFYTQINSAQPFDVDVDYHIFDEGFETEIYGNTVQAAHHPHDTKREDSLAPPDPRIESQEEKDPDTIDELLDTRNEERFLDRLFSVRRYTNRNTDDEAPSLSNTDIAIYDHVHMPYPRNIGDKIILGLGGRRFNYQSKADSMPERSMHLTSFEDDKVHALHFDAEWDEIFEHQIFDQSGEEVEMFDVPTPRGHTNNTGYLPIQSRFNRDQIIRDSWEEEEDMPELWANREA